MYQTTETSFSIAVHVHLIFLPLTHSLFCIHWRFVAGSGRYSSRIFPTAFVYFMSPCHIKLILTIFQAFSLLCLLLWLIGDLQYCYWNHFGAPWSVQFSCSVMSGSLLPHETRHAMPPCPSLTHRVHPNPCPLCRWCHPTISSSVLLLLPSIFPSIRVFSKESVFHIRWPKYWSFSFSISPSNEYPGLISFRMDWMDLLKP